MVGMRSHTFKRGKSKFLYKEKTESSSGSLFLYSFFFTCRRLVLILLSVHCLATSLASLVTSSDALAMSLAHWISARLLPLPPRTSRDISAISRAIRLAAAMMSLPCGLIKKGAKLWKNVSAFNIKKKPDRRLSSKQKASCSAGAHHFM